MSDDPAGCQQVSVSSATGLPGLSQTKAVKRLCMCVCMYTVYGTKNTKTCKCNQNSLDSKYRNLFDDTLSVQRANILYRNSKLSLYC